LRGKSLGLQNLEAFVQDKITIKLPPNKHIIMTPEPHITIITLSEEELSTKHLESHNLQAAVEALHRDGICVIGNAVEPAHLDKLNARMVPEAKTLYAKKETHRNFGPATGNIQQEPVVDKDYIFEDVIANPFAVSVAECLLGPNPMLRFQSANTAFKATERQPPHIDVHFDFPNIPFGLCININLVATSPENGATEIWLGSHNDIDISITDPNPGKGIRTEVLEARRKISPPIQPTLPKGALIIRDFRLFHAGMPNKTDDPRIMLVSILFPKWYRNDLKVVLPKALEDQIEWGNLTPCVDWVDEEYDYLQGRHDHDFSLLP